MLPQFSSTLSVWEINYKTNVVGYFSNAELRTHFEDLRVNTVAAVPAYIHDALDVIIGNPVGKSVISDIIASLEPRVLYMRSLRTIVSYIEARKDGTAATDALRVAFGVVNTLSPGGFANPAELGTKLKAVGVSMLSKLNASPEYIAQQSYTGDLFTLPANLITNAGILHAQLNTAVGLVEASVSKYLFQFADGDDEYSPTTRTISISSTATPKSSVIVGPRLATYGTVVGVAAKQETFLVDERLIHEILHYYHVTLKEEYKLKYFSNIELLSKAIISAGFYPSYTGVLLSLWTHPEELRTITGLLINETGGLCYSENSEYRYISNKHKYFRCSHSSNYCTKVPWYFMDVITNKTGIAACYVPGEDRVVDYKKQNDDLI
jgi:hypothetical protein